MARECIDGCWRIQQQLEIAGERRLMSGPLSVHPDYFMSNKPIDTVLQICEASYDCPGPGTTEVEVVKGFFNKRKETKVVPTCGLSDERFEQ